MSSQVSPVLIEPVSGNRGRLVRRARMLSWLTIGWMTIEAGVPIVTSIAAGSVALLGFGLDSVIELVSAGTILWLYSDSRGHEVAERRAQQVIAGCFAALAAFLLYDGVHTLASGSHPQVSWPGAAIAGAAIIVMPLLGRAKNEVATGLGSAATAGDAAQSWLCAISAAGVLISIVANAAFGAWWLDPVIGLAIAGLAVHEGRQAWAGEVCVDCAPVVVGAASHGCDGTDCC